jgi:hypothetical protein
MENMLGNTLRNGEHIGNLMGTHWEPRKNEKKSLPPPPPKTYMEKKQGTLSACLRLPIGCMKFLFTKELVTIFGLGSYPLQRTPYLLCFMLISSWVLTDFFFWKGPY